MRSQHKYNGHRGLKESVCVAPVLFFVTKCMSYLHRLSVLSAVVVTAIFFFTPSDISHVAYAQSSMSGGGYTLDGSLTVFTASASSTTGGYTVANNGDPISAQHSTGGIYTISPTPFDIPKKPIEPVTPSTGVSPAGFTQIQGQVIPIVPHTNADLFDFDPKLIQFQLEYAKSNRPSELFNTGLNTGLEWSDTGDLINIDKNGAATGNSSNPNTQTPEQPTYLKTKVYPTITVEQKKMVYLILLLLAFARLFKKKSESVIHRHREGFVQKDVDRYVVSRYPVMLMVDYLVSLHKNIPLSSAMHEARNVKATTGTLGFFVGNILVTLICLCAIILTYQISLILSIVFSLIFAMRIFIWYKL